MYHFIRLQQGFPSWSELCIKKLISTKWKFCPREMYFSTLFFCRGVLLPTTVVYSNWWCVQIILVTHNYLLISTTSKLMHTAINHNLWPYSYKIHHLIVCEMKTVDISFHAETSNLRGSLVKRTVVKVLKPLPATWLWANHFSCLIFDFVSCHLWTMVPISSSQTQWNLIQFFSKRYKTVEIFGD